MAEGKQTLFRELPSVDAILQDDAVQAAVADAPRSLVTACVREAVAAVRCQLQSESATKIEPGSVAGRVRDEALRRIAEAHGPYYRHVINATGVILHTALGRAVLCERAVQQIAEELRGYSLLQADVETGQRDRRDARIEWLLRQLTGAEAATVVNNNAAGTALALNTVAAGNEVIISRGQLVEIGGAFRLPDVVAASGAKLVEVGTTNRTHPRDYENAVNENTAAILRVHPSNYKISGFTSETPLEELIRIARAKNIALIDDLGAGALFDVSRFGLEREPLLAESIRAGSDLVLASADKLIGSSQGGIILGKEPWIRAVRKNPFSRIVRVGKLTLAALEATLLAYFDESKALAEIPAWRMVSRSLTDLTAQAKRMAKTISARVATAKVEVVDGDSEMGSGSLPGQTLPTRLVALSHPSIEPGEIAARLRRGRPPVFARIQKDRVLFDPRTVLEGQEKPLVEAVAQAIC